MKKKLLILLTIILAFSITGCQSKEKVDESTESEKATETDESEEAPDVTDEQMKDFEEIYVMKDVFPQLRPDTSNHPVAKIETSEGDIEVVLYPEYAPKAVENFIELSKKGYYEGVVFHRVIEDFMIQTGDPTGIGSGGESFFGEPFEDEFSVNLYNLRGALSMANSGPNTNGSQFFIIQNGKLDQGYSDTFKSLMDKDIADSKDVRYYKANFNQFLMPGSDSYLLHSNVGVPKVIMEKYIAAKGENGGGAPHLDYKHTVFGQTISGFDVIDKIAKVKVDANSKPEKNITIDKITITEPES